MAHISDVTNPLGIVGLFLPLDVKDFHLVSPAMAKPKVSILIPVYNAGKLLRPCVESALQEAGKFGEIILVDDGSTDDAVQSIIDLPVTIIRKRKNAGAARALNTALQAARGTYITFLDADDLMAPQSIAWRVRFLEKNPKAQAVGGRPAGMIDANGKPMLHMKHLLHPKFKVPKEITFEFLKNGGLYPIEVWNYMFRRSLLRQIGQFRPQYKIAYDVDYFYRIIRKIGIPVVFKPTIYRRLHAGNISMQRKKISSARSCQLKPQTIRECRAILKRNGLRMTNTKPWALSYGLK